MFKTNEEIIIIQAKAATPIPTGVVFWSHDKGTAKMLFQLQKDYVNQTLSEGTIVPICLDFVGGRHIYHAVIEDAINGIVSIVLEDNILGYVGRVTGSIYIELPDSRSLDTAGRFTFDIKRSPIDLNTPELEDYYWQGFNEIIDEYHQTINTIKSEAKALLDSITADVTTAQSKITQLEQSITTANTNLNARIDEINQKIDDNDVFTKAESSANVIYQIIGKEKVQIPLTLDFKDKIYNSFVENPHIGKVQSSNELLSPVSGEWMDFSQLRYDRIKSLDNTLTSTNTKVSGRIQQNLFSYNVLEALKRQLGEEFFISQGANDLASQISLIKKIMISASNRVRGYGSGPNGNMLTTKLFGNNVWSNDRTTNKNTITEVVQHMNQSAASFYLNSDGFVYCLALAEASDGTTVSSLSIDYASLDITIELSMNQFIKSTIAANHGKKIATQEEAEAGTDNTKTMTP
ncbi:BppU family phage baseplate upper protein, partial [Enterococcus avium]|uniref:BppU family phage baseplate upper protein n=1 Tax=Enterococcus avium TaxID=33945 RepID=UPI0032E4D56A